MKFLFAFLSLVFLCACSPTLVKKEDAQVFKSVDLLLISRQAEPRLDGFQQGYNPNIGAIGMAIADGLAQSRANENAEKISKAFFSKGVNRALAAEVKESLIKSRDLDIRNIEVDTDERVKRGHINTNGRENALLAISMKHCFVPTQNLFETHSLITLFKPLSPKPFYSIEVIAQSEIFAEPRYEGGPLADRDPETLARETEAVNRRFDKQIAENPGQKDALEKQRQRELKITKRMKANPLYIRYPIVDLVNDEAEFNRILFETKMITAQAIEAAIIDSLTANPVNHEAISIPMLPNRGRITSLESNGYLLKPYSQHEVVVFRPWETGMMADAGPNRIYAFPKRNKGIYFLGGCQNRP